MALSIFPTLNDVGGNGAGKYATEANLAKFLLRVMKRNSVISGGTYAGAAGLIVTVAAPEAVVEGYIAKETANLTIAVAANQTNYIYWKLTRDGQNYVTGVTLAYYNMGGERADHVLLMSVTTNATDVTGNADLRPLDMFAGVGGHSHDGIDGNGPAIGAIAKSPTPFGDGTDGAFSSSGNTTFAVGADDGGPVIKQYTGFMLNAGHTMTVDRRCKALIILCQGDATINGTIHMNNLAARVTRNTGGVPWTNFAQVSYSDELGLSLLTLALSAGGNGGAGGAGAAGDWSGGGAGGAGSNCAYGGSSGGGGGGGGASWAAGGGGGGGAGHNGTGGRGGDGGSNGGISGGGTGGVGAGTGAAGGSKGSGTGNNGVAGGGGGGGMIIIIAKGNITINSGAALQCNSTGAGGAGGAGVYQSSYWSGGGAGGGGAGGGVVFLAYGGTYANLGSITVNGSSYGAGGGGGKPGPNGTSGSAGSITTKKVVA